MNTEFVHKAGLFYNIILLALFHKKCEWGMKQGGPTGGGIAYNVLIEESCPLWDESLRSEPLAPGTLTNGNEPSTLTSTPVNMNEPPPMTPRPTADIRELPVTSAIKIRVNQLQRPLM